MIRFEPTHSFSNAWHQGGPVEFETMEEVEKFFHYWDQHPFKLRIYIEDGLIKFQYTSGMYHEVIELGRILD